MRNKLGRKLATVLAACMALGFVWVTGCTGPVTGAGGGGGGNGNGDTITLTPVDGGTNPVDGSGDAGSTIFLEGAMAEFPDERDVMVLTEDGEVGSVAFLGSRTGSGDEAEVTITGFSIDTSEDIILIATDDEGRPSDVALSPGSYIAFDYNDDGTFNYSLTAGGQVLVSGSDLVPAEDADVLLEASSLALKLTPLELLVCAGTGLTNSAGHACHRRGHGFSEDSLFASTLRQNADYLKISALFCTLYHITTPRLVALRNECCEFVDGKRVDTFCCNHVNDALERVDGFRIEIAALLLDAVSKTLDYLESTQTTGNVCTDADGGGGTGGDTQVGPVTSTFDYENERWSIGPAGDYLGRISDSGEADFERFDGHPDGYIHHENIASGKDTDWFFIAPREFHGDRSSAYGKKLTFDLRVFVEESEMYGEFVVLSGGDKHLLVYGRLLDLPPPASTWTSYSISLDTSAGWRVTTDFSITDEASAADIREVLSSLSSLRIRGQFDAGPGSGELDNVVLGAD